MKRILILCTGNSARSQMAEGLLRSFDSGLEVHSAGTKPASRVHPGAIQAMAEAGIDIGGNYPKSVDRYLGEPFDFVITVCDHANETCPVFGGRVGRRVHIGFEDPAAATGTDEQVLHAFRLVRDQIRDRLGRFYREEIAPRLPFLIRPAEARDLDSVSALLRSCDLPTEGLADQFGASYAVAESGRSVVGVAGVEVYGDTGLLRSVAADPARRGEGIARSLVENRMRWADGQGLGAVYLLTNTGAGYFERLGFVEVGRESLPDEIKGSREFARICPASAIVMRRPPRSASISIRQTLPPPR